MKNKNHQFVIAYFWNIIVINAVLRVLLVYQNIYGKILISVDNSIFMFKYSSTTSPSSPTVNKSY